MQLLSTGLLSLCSKDLEEKGEDVDDIQVDVESGEDVFFWTHGVPLVPHKELGIKCQKLQHILIIIFKKAKTNNSTFILFVGTYCTCSIKYDWAY